MTQWVCLLSAVLAWVSCGCEHDRCEITMRRQGGVVHRTLTVCRVGGPGALVYVPSSMEHTLGHVERFRGDDDLAGAILRQLKAADRLMDLLVICAKRKFGKQKGFAKLRAFLGEDARRDLKDLLMYTG